MFSSYPTKISGAVDRLETGSQSEKNIKNGKDRLLGNRIKWDWATKKRSLSRIDQKETEFRQTRPIGIRIHQG